VIADLQGFEAAAGAWERAILPARVVGYDPAWLDALCLSGGRQLGTPRRPARWRHTEPRGADRARAPRRPALAAGARRRSVRRGAVARRARRGSRTSRAQAPASSTKSSPERAACAPRSKTRWASWYPPDG
jgi:ATP-dependent Lhr-like helicase